MTASAQIAIQVAAALYALGTLYLAGNTLLFFAKLRRKR